MALAVCDSLYNQGNMAASYSGYGNKFDGVTYPILPIHGVDDYFN